jgi:hypothetical protein
MEYHEYTAECQRCLNKIGQPTEFNYLERLKCKVMQPHWQPLNDKIITDICKPTGTMIDNNSQPCHIIHSMNVSEVVRKKYVSNFKLVVELEHPCEVGKHENNND